MYNELENKAENSPKGSDADSTTAEAFRSELYTQRGTEPGSTLRPLSIARSAHDGTLAVLTDGSPASIYDSHPSMDDKGSKDGSKDSTKDATDSKDPPLSTEAINPEDLNDPKKLAQILIDAKAAHEAWERENESEMAWSDFYTNYINDRLRAGGHEPLDATASARLSQIFADAGKAHHQFEIDTGEEDKDWPGWYANYIIKARQAR